MKPACTNYTKSKIICLQECKSKLILDNVNCNKIKKVVVDGCQIIDGIKCDYFLLVNNIEYYVELKGCDIDHALEQVTRTIELLSQCSRTKSKICIIICTRCPISSTKIQVLRANFRKKFNSDLIIKGSPYTHKL